ncbi:PPK2 family polyphosphate kinase [Aureliella helgolandensis]|uniref:Polyphosphate kinase 2 (PPK2) n=1 Tax=Aureliella helgolandensis TaxID=2527968 RepID=A0A518G677_9BACT|nr:PPK2 family polyphosphate kinase [Aureliella helgolandensis]QDV24098.1 Polyphosphate kinase 2 (PPK2) [Aureliella helgolandensis]
MAKKHRFDSDKFVVEYEKKLSLSRRPTQAGQELDSKTEGREALAVDVTALKAAQELLYASNSHSLLIILQGMDAAGKDSTIEHVMGAVNPQGCRVYSFKAPSATELQHHFLSRPVRCMPARGMISIFNRSYYEEVVVVRVHPKFLEPQRLPGLDTENPKSIERLWRQRYQEINAFEKTLADNGTLILKFFLHVSLEEQRERFLERLNNPEKYWKFNAGDLAERKLWPKYHQAFEDALKATSTKWAPWYVIPADDKWYSRAAIADIVAAKLEGLKLKFPNVDEAEVANFAAYAQQLREE